MHVRQHLGALQIQKLQVVHLAELYAKLLREGRRPRRPRNAGATVPKAPKAAPASGLSARTVGHVHRVLHKALRVAVEWGITQRNVADIARPPKVEGREIASLSEAQATDLIQKLRGRTLYPIAVVGLATGMRRGELLALRWRDVDFDAGKLRVEQSMEQTKAGLRFKAPKTRQGRRTITLPASVVTELRAHWTAQQEHRLRLGAGKAPNDALVFSNWDGTPRSPNAITREWARTLARIKLPKISLHALRHTHVSQLIASGMDVLTISRRLGHSKPTTTLNEYGHLFGNSDDRAAQVIEAAFGKALTE